jgi:hypothetical protein
MQDKIGMPLDEIHLSGHVPQCEFLSFYSRHLFSGYVSLAFSLFFGRVEFSFILLCCSIFVSVPFIFLPSLRKALRIERWYFCFGRRFLHRFGCRRFDVG